jgi:hypothetical protein
MSMKHVGRRIGWLAAALVLAVPAGQMVHAKPWDFPGREGPARQPRGTTVMVYIPLDPTPGGNRHTYVAKGFEIWNANKDLKAAKIQFVAKIGVERPADDKTGIDVQWTPDKPKVDGEEKVGVFQPRFGDDKTAAIQGGSMQFWSDVSQTDEQIWRVSSHEFGHALGLWHSNGAGDVMNDESGALKLSEDDLKEVSDTYRKERKPRKPKVKPTVIPIGKAWRYSYELEWNGGKEISFFEIGIGNAEVWDLVAASGWSVGPHSPSPGSDIDTSELTVGNYRNVAFRIEDSLSYLGPDNPTLTFEFTADRAPRTGRGWLGGGVGLPAPVPEPATWMLLVAGFGLAGAMARGRPKAAAAKAQP